MMHGHEKSDSVIVAAKPANKAERSAAELVEPRAETKGNAGWQSTLRTQSRACGSQALARMRQAFAVRTRGRSRMRESSQRVGMDPRDQARWLPAHCPGRTSQSRGPPDRAETAQAFPRTVYLESCYRTQCSPRSLFSHSIILAAYPLAKTQAGDRVNVRNALP